MKRSVYLVEEDNAAGVRIFGTLARAKRYIAQLGGGYKPDGTSKSGAVHFYVSASDVDQTATIYRTPVR